MSRPAARASETPGRRPVRQTGAAPEQRQLGAGEHLVLVALEETATVREQADPHRLLAAGAARRAHSERRDGQQPATRDRSARIGGHPHAARANRGLAWPPAYVDLVDDLGAARVDAHTVPSIVLVTHTEPAPAATPLCRGPWESSP